MAAAGEMPPDVQNISVLVLLIHKEVDLREEEEEPAHRGGRGVQRGVLDVHAHATLSPDQTKLHTVGDVLSKLVHAAREEGEVQWGLHSRGTGCGSVRHGVGEDWQREGESPLTLQRKG
eukprot:scaffold2653_cov176-Ochromonas_danica.AAC.4